MSKLAELIAEWLKALRLGAKVHRSSASTASGQGTGGWMHSVIEDPPGVTRQTQLALAVVDDCLPTHQRDRAKLC